MKLKKNIIILTVILAILAILGAYRVVSMRTANYDNSIPIYITEGETFDGFMVEQQKNMYIEHPTIFRMMAKIRGLDKHMRTGHYLMHPDMRYIELIQKLYRGQQDPLRVTIGKFRTPQQLNEFLNKKLMHDDFNITLDSFHIIRPDTYEFYWTVTPETFMQRMRSQYDRENLDKETVILASIVEEETNHNPEKPLIASVYLNRLKRGMPLQADPTVKYAVGDFTLRRILNKHLAVESPFNTYLHAGLPPAPICLPSKASVDAVRNAPETNYLYFCASEKMDGTHRFAATLSEHQRNAARFHKALNQRGIK